MLLDDGVQIVRARCLPCAFPTAGDCLAQLIAELQPVMVIAAGLGWGLGAVIFAIERVAINVGTMRVSPITWARSLSTLAVVVGGPAAYFSTLPIKAMVKAVREVGDCGVGFADGGTFVCNQVFYLLQHALVGTGYVAGLFMCPTCPGSGEPTMALSTLVEGLRVAVLAAGKPRWMSLRSAVG